MFCSHRKIHADDTETFSGPLFTVLACIYPSSTSVQSVVLRRIGGPGVVTPCHVTKNAVTVTSFN